MKQKNKPKKLHHLFLWSAVMIIGFTSVFAFLIFDDLQIDRSIRDNLYPNAMPLQGEDAAPTIDALNQIYFWADDPLDVVRDHYEAFVPTFTYSDDGSSRWWIAPYPLGTNTTMDLALRQRTYRTTTHDTFCSSADTECMTITLIDAAQQNTMFDVPDTGTIIIYGYYDQR